MSQENIQPKKEDEIYCPNCAMPIKKEAVVCSHCGVQIKESKVDIGLEKSNDENGVIRLLIEGKNRRTIINKLIRQNWSKDKATQFVNGIEYNLRKETPGYRKFLSKKYKTEIILTVIGFILWSVLAWAVLRAEIFKSTISDIILMIFFYAVLFLCVIYFIHCLIFWLRYRR